jgi:hypothetical protein
VGYKEAPKGLQAYLFHGVELVWSENGDAVGTCPICTKEKHFYINQETGQYQCKVCAEQSGNEKGGGNVFTFLQKYWEYCREFNYNEELMDELAEDRGLKRSTLIEWGVARSVLRDEWLLPAFNQEKKLVNLYRRVRMKRKDGSYEWKQLGTPNCNHGLFGMNLWENDKPNAKVLEGPWDGMAVWEILKDHREDTPGKFVRTTDKKSCLLYSNNVVAVPGCEQFREQWTQAFKGKNVDLMYDSDHPRRTPQDKLINPAGFMGMKRAVSLLSPRAKTVRILDWGPDGYNPELPSGYDVRDVYSDRGARGVLLLPLILPPEEWATEVVAPEAPKQKLESIACNDYAELISSWRKALKWTYAMDVTLSVMLACVTSTDIPGDQLWIRVIGPPGSAKSTLCEAISNCTEFTFPTSVQRGFHSGYVGSKDDAGKDSSLIPLINGKTVIIKDGDTLLTSPSRDQILGELRDIWDRVTRAHYKNHKHSVYDNLSVTCIIAGTRSLRRLNRACRGDRFLDTIIYDRAQQDIELEGEILSRAGFASLRNFKQETNDDSNGLSERMREATRITSGYVEWLRNNAKQLALKVHCPDSVVHTCVKLGDLVSHMRARPEKDEDEEDDEVELATRLTSQFVRLANCLAIVMNKTEVDAEVMNRVYKVALDTSRGNHLTIAKELFKQENGIDARLLSIRVKKSDVHVRKVLHFMHSIGMVRPDLTVKKSGAQRVNKHVWMLTPKMRRLYRIIAERQYDPDKVVA